MRSSFRTDQLSLTISLSLAIFCCGCGGGSDIERMDVSGTASFAGQPIVYGTIEFVPDTAKGHSGPAGSADIIDGKYDTAKNGQAIVKGPHQVRVTAYPEPLPQTEPVDDTPISGPEPLFVGYALELDLQTSEQNIEVPASAKGFRLSGQGQMPRYSNEP